MKSPRLKNHVLAFATIAFGLTGVANAATYSLTMHTTASSTKYLVDPIGNLETELTTGGVLTHYAVQATAASGTQYWTFCLEKNQTFASGQTYDAEPSLGADSFDNPLGPNGSAIAPDPISFGTAFLYEQFATGMLNGFNYNDPIGSGVALQNAIWWLEGEAGIPLDSSVQHFLDLASGQNYGLGLTYLDNYLAPPALPSDSQLRYGVGVLNLTQGNDKHQDNLVYWGPTPSRVPTTDLSVPDGGTSALLMSLSLGGLGIVRRYLRV